MAVQKVTRLADEGASQDANGKRLTERYHVYVEWGDSVALGFKAVDPDDDTVSVPDFGDAHRDDANLKVTNVDPTWWQEDPGTILLVTVQYNTNQNQQAPPADGGTGPWNKRVSGSGNEVLQRANKDRNGDAIRNSFRDLVDYDFEEVHHDEVITVAFNTLDSSIIRHFRAARGCVNDKPITLNVTRFGITLNETFQAGTLRLGNATWAVDVGPGGGYWDISIPLIYRYQVDASGAEIGWRVQYPDRGYRYKVKVGGREQDRIVKSETLVDLDGKGGKLAEGSLQVLLQADMLREYDFMKFLKGI